jgi:hypothetical protein
VTTSILRDRQLRDLIDYLETAYTDLQTEAGHANADGDAIVALDIVDDVLAALADAADFLRQAHEAEDAP